ncbi:MAG: helix-turn-helix domain-containing protein [Burkholderiaceae bacterium]|jgi:CRP/FNR family transcriptional regulator|nr:helix-turn-helix domain-containing protein [Burkholderiaceae bacterium]
MPLEAFKVACSQCSWHDLLCVPAGLPSKTVQARLGGLVASWRGIKPGDTLFSSGTPFTALYAIQTGFFKTSATTTNGCEQVTGFYMAGEVIGLDGIASDRYTCEAIALEAAHVCVMPYARISALTREMPGLQTCLDKIMSREIVRQHNVMLMLGGMRAEERIAAFLLDLSHRMHVRGFSRSDLVLRMSRGEIGSYLGLKLETVSRTFSRLAEQGILEVKQRNVHIRDIKALHAMLNIGAQMQDAAYLHTP